MEYYRSIDDVLGNVDAEFRKPIEDVYRIGEKLKALPNEYFTQYAILGLNILRARAFNDFGPLEETVKAFTVPNNSRIEFVLEFNEVAGLAADYLKGLDGDSYTEHFRAFLAAFGLGASRPDLQRILDFAIGHSSEEITSQADQARKN